MSGHWPTVAIALALSLASACATNAQTADTIFVNGKIVQYGAELARCTASTWRG